MMEPTVEKSKVMYQNITKKMSSSDVCTSCDSCGDCGGDCGGGPSTCDCDCICV